MKRVAFIIYRKWAYEIFENIMIFQKEHSSFIVSVLVTSSKAEFKTENIEKVTNLFTIENENDHKKINEILSQNNIDVVFYYGWSWMAVEPILSKYICLCLHPSPLPKYRGGSPIQNQIINGELESAVSVFRMKEGIDDGDIYKQIPIPLSGTVDDIFARMTSVGTIITKQFIIDLINNKVVFVPQQFLEETYPLKRRLPKQSEIALAGISSMSFTLINNMVRSLLYPYPNVFISFPDGKLLMQEIRKYEKTPTDGIILNEALVKTINEVNPPFYLHLLDGYILIAKFTVENI